MIKFLKNQNTKLFIALTIMIIIIFSPILFFGHSFYLNNDHWIEYRLFYIEWIRMIRLFLESGQLPFYSWYKFLGSDFYSSNIFYVVTDPFIPVHLLFEEVNTSLFIETIVLIYISAFSFKTMIKTFEINNSKFVTMGAIVYALSGTATLYFGNFMFHRFYALLPFFFSTLNNLLMSKKNLSFILAFFVLLTQNAYLSFVLTLITPFYIVFFLKYHSIFEFRKYIRISLKVLFSAIVSVCLSAFIIIPFALVTLNNPRAFETNFYTFFWPLNVNIGFFISSITGPFPLYTEFPTVFQSGYNGHAFWYSIYSSAFVFFYSLIYIVKFRKKGTLFIVIPLLMLLFLPYVNLVGHGLSEPSLRITYIHVFFIILFGTLGVDQIEFHDVKKLAFFYITGIILLMVLLNSKVSLFELYKIQLSFILISIGILLLVIIYLSNSYSQKILLTFILIEVTSNATLEIYYLSKNFYVYPPSIENEYLNYFQSQDEDLIFRMYVDPSLLRPLSSLNLNQSLFYQFMSTSTYDSFYEPNLIQFINMNNIEWHIIHIDDYQALRMLGVKYYMTDDATKLPTESRFELVYDLGYLDIYKDLNYLPFGFTYQVYKTFDEINNNDVQWSTIAYIDKKDFDYIEKVPLALDYFKVNEKYANGFKGDIFMNNKNILFLSLPYNEGWTFTDNGNEIEALKMNGGFVGLPLDTGMHTIQGSFFPYGLKLGVIISGVSLMGTLIFVAYSKIKNKFYRN